MCVFVIFSRHVKVYEFQAIFTFVLECPREQTNSCFCNVRVFLSPSNLTLKNVV